MRLIDADDLLSIIERRISDYSRDSNTGAQRMAVCYMELKQLITSSKTAYDKNKVIEKLEDTYNSIYVSDDLTLGLKRGLSNAIEIVTKEGD